MSAGLKCRPVLILGAATRISVPIARSLQRHGIPVDIASFQPEEPDIRSRAIRKFYRLPARRQDPAAFTAALWELVRKEEFDLVLPAGDPALAALADHHSELSQFLHVGCPPPRSVEKVLNKSLTLEAAQSCGIRVPFTCRIADGANLDSIGPRLRFPVVVKPEKRGTHAFKAFYFNSLSELATALESHDWGSILVQEYCPGMGVGIEILIHKGKCVAKFQHRRLREAPYTGGVAVVAISEDPNPALVQSSMALLRVLEWEGVAMVEFRVDQRTGASALMEVNGRFWGSLSLPLMAGVDFPLYYWQLVHGEKPSVSERYHVGLRWRWSPGCLDRIQSVMLRSATGVGPKPSRLRELLRVPADFSPVIKEALWSWSDPIPFFAEMAIYFGELIRTLFKGLYRRLLPRRLQSYAGIYFRLVPEARPSYARLRIYDALRIGRRNGKAVPQNASSFLFVCFGNKMRSPMAEAMLKHILDEQGIEGLTIKSAGLHAAPGHEAHEWALAVSRELGLPLDHHRAQLLTPELVSSADVIFVMDFENLAELETLYPGAKSKIIMLSNYAEDKQRNREIPDPYFGDIDTTRRCYSTLSNCIDKLASDISSFRQSRRPSVGRKSLSSA